MRIPSVRRIRQHHAIEHATVAVLFERRGGRFPILGWADPGGFSIIGRVDVDEVEAAANEALRRLHEGYRGLAITDLCGSNILITAALVAATTLAVTGRRRWHEFPAAVSAGSFAMLAAPFVGRLAQRYATTDANVAGLTVTGVRALPHPGPRVHCRVRIETGTQPSPALPA